MENKGKLLYFLAQSKTLVTQTGQKVKTKSLPQREAAQWSPVQYTVLICYGHFVQRESKNITFPFCFSSWHKLTCNCSHLAHTLSTKRKFFLLQRTKKKEKKKSVSYQLALHNFSLMFDLDLFHASRLLGKDSEVLTVQPLSPSANRCVGKAQISSCSFTGSINNLFVLIHQVCGCRKQSLCSMWGLSISWMSTVSWCISLSFQ